MEKSAKIYVSGHSGLLGNAVLRVLADAGYKNIITETSGNLDLRNQNAVHDFFKMKRPDYVFHLAARVGGMQANISRPAEFIYDNLIMQNNVFQEAHLSGVRRLLFTGSNCMYPRVCPQPMKEEYLFTGIPEPTNEAYAVAKLAGLSMCQSFNKQYHTTFIVAIPASFYGSHDHFGSFHAHMIPELISTLHVARRAGTKKLKLNTHPDKVREFIYVDDVARACLCLMESPNDVLVPNQYLFNVGNGKGIKIRELAQIIKRVVDYQGDIEWDRDAKLGMPEKVLDATRIANAKWNPQMSLEDGLSATYEWFLQNETSFTA